jgi:hypothetical protein
MKKITVLGGGNAGVTAVSHFLRWSDFEIDWISDSSTPAVPVGESTLHSFTKIMSGINFRYENLKEIDGTVKLGIYKENWCDQPENTPFYESFFTGTIAFHISANTLQSYLQNFLKDQVNIIDKKITNTDEIDSDFIIDCRGFPKDYEDCNVSDYINVNTAYVTQCYWDYPKYDYTLTIARPYGWCFGIPLQNRLSIGYLYNSNINTLEEVKADVQNVFDRFGVTPSEDTVFLPFKSFYRKQNFTNRIGYSGNSSFFLEPLEATSIDFMDSINRSAWEITHNTTTVNEANNLYIKKIEQIQTIIMLHYINGSAFNTDFWEFAKDRSNKRIEDALKNDPDFVELVQRARSWSSAKDSEKLFVYGSWEPFLLRYNMLNLGLDKHIKAIQNRIGN